MKRPFQNLWGNPQIGKETKLAAFVEIGSTLKYPTTIGKNCSIQAFTFIPPGIVIEDNVFVGPHTCFTNDKHPPSNKWEMTLVKEGAVIGANVTILPGVVIGKNAVIGAGSVVTKNVNDDEVVVGNPAKPL